MFSTIFGVVCGTTVGTMFNINYIIVRASRMIGGSGGNMIQNKEGKHLQGNLGITDKYRLPCLRKLSPLRGAFCARASGNDASMMSSSSSMPWRGGRTVLHIRCCRTYLHTQDTEGSFYMFGSF